MTLIDLFIFSLVLFMAISYTYERVKKSKNKRAKESVEEVQVMRKSELPFELPFPKERLIAVLYKEDIRAYCLFAISYPELHITIKFVPEQFISQKELEELVRFFTTSFVSNFKIRCFLDAEKSLAIHEASSKLH